MNHSIEVVIDGREAIPVRAIPYVTGWIVSPDMAALFFSHTDQGEMFRDLTTYHLLDDGRWTMDDGRWTMDDGRCAPILPKEWDGISDKLQALSNNLRSAEKIAGESRPTWLHESIPLLPAGVFVWKDEFAKVFGRDFSPLRYGFTGERVGDRELNFSPLIPVDLQGKVIEGFATNAAHHDTELRGAPKNHVSIPHWENPERLEFLAREIGKQWMGKTKPKPGVDAIAQHVEGELKRRNKTGPRGDYWDWQTIKKEALTGITGRKANGKK